MKTAPLLLWLYVCLLFALPAAAKDEDPALTDLVRILREQGVLDQQQYETLTAKASQQDERSWLDRIEIWGDLRGRYESFYFFGTTRPGLTSSPDRHRLRYRLLLNLKGEVNDYSDVFVQLATGADSRTLNNTIGDPLDFARNGIHVQHAYARVSPFKDGALPDADGSLFFFFGRTPQPWRWSIGKDILLWDDELSPAGLYGDGKLQLTDSVQLFSNAGFFVIDEESSGRDPMMTNVQLGVHADTSETFDIGGRTSWYAFFDLEQAFLQRGINATGPSEASNSFVNTGATTAAGNLFGGLTGDPNGGMANVLEFEVYAKANWIERWPILFYGEYSRNLDASASVVTNPGGTFNSSSQGNAWLLGIDVGDPKEIVRFRMLYAWLEANAFPAQFVDSDLFDGFTNGKGFYWDIARQVSERVYVNFTAMYSQPIHTSGAYLMPGATDPAVGPLVIPVQDRLRTQANVVFSF